MEIKQDIHKLGRYLEKACQEGVALERKIDEWKAIEARLGHTEAYQQALDEIRRQPAA